jgi:hypothetical protein
MTKSLEPNKNPLTPFAVTNYRNIRTIFGIREKNRRGHIYIVGKTGTGKSTLISNMAASDAKEGQGLALIDPHGDLAEALLDSIPKPRIKDVIYFNPADIDHPIAFNPLENVAPEKRHLVASGLISVFKKIWPEFWGPRLEHILRHTLLTLLEYPGATLLDVTRLLTIKDYRAVVLNCVRSPHVREFWFFEFEKYSAWLRSEAISPILNKMSQFLTSEPLRNIVGQKKNALDFRKIMDEGKILVVNLAKGKIGEDNCSLLGAIIVTKIQLAALSRTDVPEHRRRSFYLFVDEVQNFMTLSFADALSEARKYGLSLVLAHQYIEQLDPKIRAAIFGNVGTLISFRVGAEDAKYLSREFYPVFSEADLTCIPNYHIYLKLMIDGHTSQPFSAVTLPPADRKESFKEKIIGASRKKYGREQKKVQEETHLESPSKNEKTPRQESLFFSSR